MYGVISKKAIFRLIDDYLIIKIINFVLVDRAIALRLISWKKCDRFKRNFGDDDLVHLIYLKRNYLKVD
jgi:hypothetical protein